MSGFDPKSRTKSSDRAGGGSGSGRDDDKKDAGGRPPLAATAKMFKKCKSATFQIDGHTYTIGRFFYFYFMDNLGFS
jgi:hypothetical protein